MPGEVIRPSAPASGRVTPASFPFYTTGEDNLRVTTWNAAAGVLIQINGRTINDAGVAKPSSWVHLPNTNRSAKVTDITLSGSTLLNLTVFAGAGTPQIGQTFVKVELIRGLGVAAIVLGTILQGYVTAAQALGWPGSPLQSSVDSGGYYRTITGTTPAVGGEVSESVPAGARWQLLGLQAVLNASATVANRWPVLNILPGGTQVFTFANVTTVAASAGGIFDWAIGFPLATAVKPGVNVGFLPIDVPLLAGGSFFTSTENLQPGDQWSAVHYIVREYLEP